MQGVSYAYNAANQRALKTEADASYWVYEYDDLGQVISGRKQWSDGTPVAGQQFEYAFDDIGNRTRAKSGGDETGGNLRQTDYVPNRLNQFISKNNPATVDVIGLAKGTTVTVKLNGTSVGTPYGRGEYFRKEVTVRPGSSAATGTLSFDVDATTPPSTTGTVGVPAATESGATLSYDADGNLTADSLWVYAWDGENRLKQMTAQDASKRLVFEYDYRSRRVLKQVFIPSSAPTATTTEKYLYDGWNPVAIWDGSTVIQKSFMWGSDLSGSMQGAGGVGGLVGYRQHTGTSAGRYFAAYDGNGNVVGLQSSSGGSPSAVYEYGPFGEVIRVSGSVAKLNPFRFSTKFQDDETDLLYYGYRFYNAGTGRWINRDPILERGGANVNLFCSNAAVGSVDFLGMDAIVLNHGGYFGHTSIGITDPLGGVVVFHFYAKNNESCKGSGSAAAFFCDKVNIWKQHFPDVEHYLLDARTRSVDQGLPSVSVIAYAFGTSIDDALAIDRLDLAAERDSGVYSLILGINCHSISMLWFGEYVKGGHQISPVLTGPDILNTKFAEYWVTEIRERYPPISLP